MMKRDIECLLNDGVITGLIKISWSNKEACNALDSVLPKFVSFLEPQDVTLFGNRVV